MGKRVIIDTDPGVDDALALALALKSEELHVEAVITAAGNVSLEQATENAALLLELLDPSPRPLLAMGSERPLEQGFMRSQSVHGIDGLGGLHHFKNPDGSPRYPEAVVPTHIPDATELLFDLLKRYPEEVVLITLGPLTNLAHALRKDKRRVQHLGEVVIMGGAIRVPGNISPAAEFNIFADPPAAHQVFQSGLPMTLVPLDVTEKVCLKAEEIQELARDMDEPLGRFVRDITEQSIEHMREERGISGIYLHDPLAVAVAIDPMMVHTSPLHVAVETNRGITQGMTLADTRSMREELKQPANLDVALEVKSEQFLTLFKERLCRR
jgi:purine nucleosidase/pyrimidine-specific ribonucleoside hydrolase